MYGAKQVIGSGKVDGADDVDGTGEVHGASSVDGTTKWPLLGIEESHRGGAERD